MDISAPACVSILGTNIGDGATSVVHSDGKCAMKSIKWRHIESAIREILFISECNHVNIIKLIDIIGGSSITLCLKLYPYDLSQYKIRGIGDIISISYGILSGVDHLHRAGIIHCDIKPQNILVEPGPVPIPVICDFGLGVRSDEKYHNNCVQTVNYRAPEVVFGSAKNKFSSRVDIWSVGCVIFEMCTGGKQLVTFVDGCEDGSIYACKIFGVDVGKSHRTRMAKLSALRFVSVMSVIITRLGITLESLVYKSGFAAVLAQCLTPNPNTRSDAHFLLSILRKIISREFPELKAGLKYISGDCPVASRLRNADTSMDELQVIQCIADEIIVNTTKQCLVYAENLYTEYTKNSGDIRLEVQLCCIFIASSVYCSQNNVLEHITELMDHESIYSLSLQILREIYCKKHDYSG